MSHTLIDLGDEDPYFTVKKFAYCIFDSLSSSGLIVRRLPFSSPIIIVKVPFVPTVAITTYREPCDIKNIETNA
jgi:hypothetical protein